jgi:RimJ/RimL family protein N-acetyltransferase
MAGPPLPARLEGDGITLRLLHESDWPLEQALSRDPDAVRWTSIEPDLDEDRARERVRRRIERAAAGTGQRWVIETDGEPHGTIGLAVTGTTSVELFYGLLPASRGRGLVTRSVGLVVAAARAAGYRAIVLSTFPDNAPSRATAARCGFVETGTRTIAIKGAPQRLLVWTLPDGQDA